jgi:hypothetical protein
MIRKFEYKPFNKGKDWKEFLDGVINSVEQISPTEHNIIRDNNGKKRISLIDYDKGCKQNNIFDKRIYFRPIVPKFSRWAFSWEELSKMIEILVVNDLRDDGNDFENYIGKLTALLEHLKKARNEILENNNQTRLEVTDEITNK